MGRTLLKVVLLVGLVAAVAWFGIGKSVISKGKAGIERGNDVDRRTQEIVE